MKVRAAPVAVVLIGGVMPVSTSIFATDSTMAAWMIVAAIGVGVAMLTPASGGRLPTWVRLALALAVSVFVLAALTGPTPVFSLIGRYPRYDGLIAVIGYGLAVIGGARVLGTDAPQENRRLFTSALAAAAIVNAVASCFQLATGSSNRITGMLGNSSILGAWSVFVVAMMLWQFMQRRSRLWLAGAIAGGVTLVLAASRGAWATAIVLLCLIPALRFVSSVKVRGCIGPAIAVGLAGLVAVVPGTRFRLADSTLAQATAGGRLRLWQDTAALISHAPALGSGPSTFVDAIGAYHSPSWAATVGPYAPPDSPHNALLQAAAAAGLLGLAAVLALIAAIAVVLLGRRPWDAWTTAAVTAAVGIGGCAMFTFTDPVTVTLSLFVLGSAVASEPGAQPRAAIRWIGRAAVAVWLAAAIAQAATILGAESLLSRGSTDPHLTTDAVSDAIHLRSWDPDLAIRGGRLLAAAAAADPAAAPLGIAIVEPQCHRLDASSECRIVLSDLQLADGKPAAAAITLTEGLSHDRVNVDMMLRLGIAQAEGGASGDAERTFTAAAALRPQAPEPWDDLAELYRRAGRTSDAQAAARKAASLR